MKLHNLHFSIILLLAISCHAFNKLTVSLASDTIWANMLAFTDRNQTVFIDIDNDSGVVFKDTLLRSIHQHNNSVYLVNEIPELGSDGKLRLLDVKPNFVFTTKFLNTSILDSPLMVFILKSHWSAMFIIVTTEENMYNCDHGNFNEKAFKNIEEFLNDLWYKHRVMNVVMNLPYVCPNRYVIYNDTKATNRGLYNRTIQLVRQEQLSRNNSRKINRMLTRNYPLRGNIFYRFPTAITDCEGTDIYIKTSQNNSGGFCGLDGLVMSDIVTHFEFNLSLPTLADNKYGYQLHDGNVTGSLGHIVKKEIDISFNSRFMVMYTTPPQQYVYIYHIAHDALCVILNQPDDEPLWLYPVNSYSLPQWLFILACLTGLGILMWVFAKINTKIYNRKADSLPSYILNSVNAGLFGSFFKRRRDLLLLRICCLYASIMVLAEYQSYINYIFTTRVRYDVLNSLSDLAKSRTIIQTSPSIYALIDNPINAIEDVLLSRTIVMEDTDSFEYVIHHPNAATLDRQSDAIMLTLMKYTDETGKPKLYVLDECIAFYYLSYITSVEFPFMSIIRLFMMRLAETGLTKMYYTWTSRALGLEVTLPNLYSEPRPVSTITIEEQVIAFGLLLVGYAASVVAFVIEIWYDRRQTYPFVN